MRAVPLLLSVVLLTSGVFGQSLPRVIILSTGGTIASQYDPEQGGLVPALTGDQLVEAVPELAELARIDVEQISNIGSPDMTPEIWLKIAIRANELLARSEVAGVVVTHGTDTLEETAYFLDLSVESTKPVIMVGAQRAPSYRDTDGPRNLLNAVRVAVSPEAIGKRRDGGHERADQRGSRGHQKPAPSLGRRSEPWSLAPWGWPI